MGVVLATKKPVQQEITTPRLGVVNLWLSDFKMKKRVAIDLVPIRVGEGGTGSGIWTYARELLHAMDACGFQGLEGVCLVNRGQLPYLSNLRNIRLVVFPNPGKNILRRLWWVHVRLPWFCFSRKVDVLHKLATETPLFCSSKRITTIHDFYYEFLTENRPSERIRLYERLEGLYFSFTTRTCFRKSKAIISVSESTRQEAIQRYPAAGNRIQVVHHGSDGNIEYRTRNIQGKSVDGNFALDRKSQAQSPKPKASLFRILCVAKFMEHKGQHLLLAGFEALLEKQADLQDRVQLDLRGFHNDGAYYEALCQQVSGSRFFEEIHLVAYNPAEGLKEIYAGVDLVVLLSSYEGFGLPVLEAQGMGIPVLCSDLPVLQEVGGAGAIYVNREDISGIAQAIRRFIDDPDYCREMTAKALKNVGRFSWEKAARETLEIYRTV